MSNFLNTDTNPGNNCCNNNNSIESCLLSFQPKKLALLSTIIGLALLDDLNIDQKNALGNFIVGIGQTILTAAAGEQALQTNNNSDTKIQDNIEELKKEIANLKNKINN